MWTRLKKSSVFRYSDVSNQSQKISICQWRGHDVSSAKQKRSFDYELTFRKPLGPDGNPLKCGDMNGDGTEDECPSMPPMKGSINVRFPTDADSVGPFENIKIKSGSDAASDLKDVSTVDAGQTIQVSASAVKKAKDYQLEIYCAGKEDSTTFEPPFGMSMRLPPNTSKPTFDIERGMIPGGRSCDFRMIAMGESNSGNPIGITLYKFNLTLKGGFGGGGIK